MTRGTTALGVGAVGAAAIGGALMYTDSTGGAPQFNDPMAINALDANPRIINEGDTVWFMVDVAEGVPNITWHFDDGSPPASGLDLKTYEHRFIDDAEEPYDVRVEAGGASESVAIRVHNVAPEIEDIDYSRPATAGSPIDFTASVVDPGRDDELSYTWDFDGHVVTGQNPRHTFPLDGVYPVELTVTDGDGGEQTAIIQVTVGESGWFEITGDVSVAPTKAEQVRVVATQAGSGPNAVCNLRIDIESGDSESGVTLTARLPRGLSKREYAVRRATEWDGMYRDETASPHFFYAEAHVPRAQALRTLANGMVVSGPFWSLGGGVYVSYFDGNYVELTFAATLRENIVASAGPRRAAIRGALNRRIRAERATDIFSALRGSTNYYTCDRNDTETFAITSRKPDSNAINVLPDMQPLRITFDRPLDPSTVAGNVELAYRAASGSAARVDGSWQPVGSNLDTLEFVPQSRLRSGVIHCISVRAGTDGLRGRDGEVLEPAPPAFHPEHARACEPIGPYPLAQDWSFATEVDVESLRVDMYQASQAGQGAPLIPSKPAVARVYAHWLGDAAAHDTAQVKHFPARVSVEVGGSAVYAPRLGAIRRPDQITAEQARNGGASSNLFGWRPGGGAGTQTVIGVVEPVDELFTPVDEIRGSSASLPFSSSANTIQMKPYVLAIEGVCPAPDECYPGWREGVDEGTAVAIEELLYEAEVFAAQNFPVGDAWASTSTEITPVDIPKLIPCPDNQIWHCYLTTGGQMPSAEAYLAQMLALLGEDSTADVLVGIVPPETGGYWGAINVTDWAGRKAILVEADEDPHVFVHEIGHAYGLRHCPATEDYETPCEDPVIRGFRMDLTGDYGFNKHGVEGNQQSQTLAPLMHETPGMFDTADVFISTSDYRILSAQFYGLGTQGRLERVPMFTNPLVRLARALLPVPLLAQEAGPDGRLIVTGLVSDRGVLVRRVAHEPHGVLPQRARSTPGDLTLDLLDASGSVLESIPFGVPAVDQPRGVARSFVVSVPAPAGLHAIRVSAPGHDPAERVRSAQAPRLGPGAVETTAGGDRMIAWTVVDADQDDVTVSVFVKSEATAGWQGIAVGVTTGSVTIRESRLPPGPQVTVRLVAEDGFNTSMAEVDIGPGAPLEASPMRPADGSERVAQNADVVARVSSPLAAPRTDRPVKLKTGSFTLVDPDGNEVFADVTYQPLRGLLVLSPIQPLRQGTRYTATIEGLEDRWGGPLAAPVTWSFETIGRLPPRGRGGR